MTNILSEATRAWLLIQAAASRQCVSALVVVIDTVASDEPGTSGNKQHGGV
jgi:hypothetical protein